MKSSQILFGSDYPWADEMVAAFTLRGVETYEGFDHEARQAIAYGNALALFPISKNSSLLKREVDTSQERRAER